MLKILVPFAAGIALADRFTLPLWFAAGAFVLTGLTALLLRSSAALAGMLLTAGFAAAQLRAAEPAVPRGVRTAFEVAVEGIPADRGRYVAAEAVVALWRDPATGRWHPSGDRVMLYADSLTPLTAGERFVCRGEVRPFRGGAESYRRLMRRRGFAGTLSVSGRTLLERLPGHTGKLHHRAAERLARLPLGGDAGAVVRAMAAGDRSGITPELRTAYSRSGLSHLLAVSGLHTGIVFALVNLALWWLPLLRRGHLVRSAALTFYTLMSLVPIAAVVFAVVKGFGLADGLVENLYALFPQNPEIVRYIVDFAENALGRTQGGVVAAVALVMLFWAVIRVFGSIESAFNNIWEVKVARSIARQWTDYIAVVMIVPVLWIVANAMTNYAERLLGFDDSWYFGLLSHLASMVVIWGMFTLLYLVIPNAKVRVGSALMAGIVAGTIFLLFQWGYVYLQRWMTSYNAIYGSFAALPLFLIWLQTSWEILLFGGELSFAYQNVERFDEERESLLVSYDQRRKILLAAMLIVVRHFRDHGGAMPAERIRRRLNLPTRIVNDVLFQLVQAGQLIAVRSGDGEREVGYTPAYDIASMTIYSILEAVERSGQTSFDLAATPELAHIDRELNGLKEAARNAEDNVTLTDLMKDADTKQP